MSTTERKARKRAGVKFVRTPKTGTPPLERSENQERPRKVQGKTVWRLTAAARRRLAARGLL